MKRNKKPAKTPKESEEFGPMMHNALDPYIDMFKPKRKEGEKYE